MIKFEVIDGHVANFPAEMEILRKFEPDFDITWGARVNKFNTDLSIYFIKPKQHISQSFGFDQELILAVSDYAKPEARFIQAIEQVFQQLPAKGRVDQTVALIVSAAVDAERWVRDYTAKNPQARAYVGISKQELISDDNSWFLRNKLIGQLFSRDLFDYTLPLNEDLFFSGDKPLLLSMLMQLEDQKTEDYSDFAKLERRQFYLKLNANARKVILLLNISTVNYPRFIGYLETSFWIISVKI